MSGLWLECLVPYRDCFYFYDGFMLKRNRQRNIIDSKALIDSDMHRISTTKVIDPLAGAVF
jgi:hypothetical protein